MTALAPKIRRSLRSLICTPVNRLLNVVDQPVIVLLYHRVTKLASDPEMLAVSPENFREHIRYLRESFPVLRFEDDWSTAPKPAVVITFDDGYADNALEALPILEAEGVPATFFVSTGTIGSGNEFWWDELERLLLGDAVLPESFHSDNLRGGSLWPTRSAEERIALYGCLVRLMNEVHPDRRNALLDEIRCWAPETGSAETDRSMTVEELRLLAESSLVTIGAHTVSHSRLSALTAAEQEEEVLRSRDDLERWLGREIRVFSYPFGRRADYTGETVALCRRAGFTRVAANFPGAVHRWTDPFQVPRHLVRDWPPEIFEEKLREFWVR